jgi:hypothetical protein
MGKVRPEPLPRSVRDRVRKIVKQAAWKAATAPEYALAPHHYIVAMKSGPEWGYLAKAIRKYGEVRSWLRRRDRKRFRYKYLVLDGYCFWVMWPVLNRARATTLDPKPRR